MIEQGPRIAREFHVGVGGDRWALMRDLQTGQPYVSHSPGDDAPEVQLDLGSFLVLFTGEEREKLLRLIGSLLPDEDARADADGRPVASADLRLPVASQPVGRNFGISHLDANFRRN